MAESPIIETPRLRITPFSEKYLTEEYVGWLNDPEVVRYSEQRHHRHTLESCREYWKSFMNSPHYFWAITVALPPEEHIGNINAYVDRKNLVADVGILIGKREAWRNGYGLEAWKAVCDYLIRVEEMRKVSAGTMVLNVGMVRLMERAGMVADGFRHRHFLHESREVDVIFKALFRPHKKEESGGQV